jgi:hypothetical protein
VELFDGYTRPRRPMIDAYPRLTSSELAGPENTTNCVDSAPATEPCERVPSVLAIHRRTSTVLLADDATLEAPSGTASTTEAMYAMMSGRRGGTRAIGQFAIVVAALCHVVLVCYFAVGQDWTFAGA